VINELVDKMAKAETDAQRIRQLEEALKRARKDLDEYLATEEVLVASGLVSKSKVEQAHELVRKV
jgi:hypothetical protein